MSLHRLLLLAAAFIALARPSSCETLRLRADNWMPFNGDPKGEHPGFAIDLCKAIFGPLGIEIDYQTQPWTEALQACKAGEIDGVIAATPKEADGLVLPKENINSLRLGFFGKKGLSWTINTIKDLDQVRVGVIADYSYWEAFDNYVKAAPAGRIVTVSGDSAAADAITKLDKGEIDIYPENILVFGWTARGLGLKTSDFKPYFIYTGEDLYIAFAPGTQKGARWAKLFDEGIHRLRSSGELKKILGTYNVEDWK